MLTIIIWDDADADADDADVLVMPGWAMLGKHANLVSTPATLFMLTIDVEHRDCIPLEEPPEKYEQRLVQGPFPALTSSRLRSRTLPLCRILLQLPFMATEPSLRARRDNDSKQTKINEIISGE